MKNIIDKLKINHNATFEDILILLSNSDINDYLFSSADEIRKKYVGDGIYLRGLIEFSNICGCNCKYCGLRADNKNLLRYKLSLDEISQAVKKAKENNYKTIVLQSGESQAYSHKEILKLIESVKNQDVALTLSIGEKTFEQYRDYKNAGADRYLLRIETTDEKLYKSIHPNMDFQNRVKCLEYLKNLEYEVGTGSLIGLPNQTVESIANDILFFKNISADMIGVGPFIPNIDTPFSKETSGDFTLALKVMAITRLFLPDINIPATTAMETLVENGRFIALKSGANVIMPNVGEFDCCKNYKIYDKNFINGNSQEYLFDLQNKLKNINRYIDNNVGISRHFLNK